MEMKAMGVSDSFVRFPTALLEALLESRLSRTQHLIVLWVVRHTYGWNRPWAAFSWYGVARNLRLDRALVYRAGERLLRAGVLVRNQDRLAVALEQRKALFSSSGDVVLEQRVRCPGATLFRPAIDSSKDRLKTKKDKRSTAQKTQRAPSRKYDRLSEN
jgi:phage replication O-like protein O